MSKSAISSNGSFSKSMNGSLTNENLIQDECELESYLKEVEQQRKCALSTSVDQPSNLLSSFWSHPATRAPGEVSPLLRRCAYQLAPTIGKCEIRSMFIQKNVLSVYLQLFSKIICSLIYTTPCFQLFLLDKTKTTSPGVEERHSPRGTFGALDVWRKYRVDPNKVNEWTANLRMVSH